MTRDQFNDFCRALPATSRVVQWSDSDVWKVGGKVFAIAAGQHSAKPTFSFKTSVNNFEILRDQPSFGPPPCLASRGLKWIQRYDARAKANQELITLDQTEDPLYLSEPLAYLYQVHPSWQPLVLYPTQKRVSSHYPGVSAIHDEVYRNEEFLIPH
ncbi:MAG: hypothetical protein JWM78_2839 [Verrucomicrobiaceae bacterium]|nr:hypothetical protein [Verrucomicrobiaceae bacterium]